jgi:hypothetical protein
MNNLAVFTKQAQVVVNNYSASLLLQRRASKSKMPKPNKDCKKSSNQTKPANNASNQDIYPVNLDKSGNLTIKIHAKPGAKINSITGKIFI